MGSKELDESGAKGQAGANKGAMRLKGSWGHTPIYRRGPVTPNVNPEEFHLVLKPVKGWPHPPIRQLAIILKRLGRQYGMKCVSARAISTETKTRKEK